LGEKSQLPVALKGLEQGELGRLTIVMERLAHCSLTFMLGWVGSQNRVVARPQSQSYKINHLDKEVTMFRDKWLTRFAGLSGLVLVAAALLSGGVLADKGNGGGNSLNLTPFARVAEIGPISDPYVADTLAKAAATAIASYVATVNDTGDPTYFPANWILGGLEGEVTEEKIEAAILRVPTPFPINSTDPESALKKVNIVEMCNPLFAQKALGLLPVVDGDDSTKIVDGYIHAPALPCEVAIYVDEEGYVNVEMLNPEAIFTLFFTDVLFGEQMEDEDFAAAIQALPVQVNLEIRTILLLALDTAGIAYTPVDPPLALGPVYRSLQQVAKVVEETPTASPYVHFAYRLKGKSDEEDSDGEKGVASRAFTSTDAKTVAEAIIATLKLTGEEREELNEELNFIDWTSPRAAPLPVPGNQVVEACSPTNAKAAMALGMYHATALPCEIAVTVVDLVGGPETETLLISYLDPHFMFGALFNDAFGDLTDEELDELMALPPQVLADLQAVVAYAIDNELEMKLTRPRQIFYDMLPDAKGKKDHKGNKDD